MQESLVLVGWRWIVGHGVVRVAHEARRRSHGLRGQVLRMHPSHHWFVQHDSGPVGRQLEWIWRHCHSRAGGEHGFSASALAAEAGTDGDEDGEADERAQKRDLSSKVVSMLARLTFINMTPHWRQDEEVNPDRQSALGIHFTRMLKVLNPFTAGALRKRTECVESWRSRARQLSYFRCDRVKFPTVLHPL
ncbi:unnamed protein product [Ixodes persulcatus]